MTFVDVYICEEWINWTVVKSIAYNNKINPLENYVYMLTAKLLRAAIDKYRKCENVSGTDRF